jgi:hypothetical protein
LEGTVNVVETFRFVTSRGSKILVGLILPVGPTEEPVFAYISNLSNFTSANFRVQTGSEFTHEEGNSKFLCIGSSLSDTLLVESEAFSRAFRSGLSSFADFTVKLAAVSVSIKGVISRVQLTTWRLVETYSSYEINNLVAKDTGADDIREDNRLEIHDTTVVGGFISFLENS